jgi:AcrR family transcriptional regulator
MQTPTRTLIAEAQNLGRVRPDITPRQCERRDKILHIGLDLMARHGTPTLSVTSLAAAVGITVASFRRYFYDLETLLADLLFAHLQRLSECLGEIPRDAPDCFVRRRAAYFEHTRAALGGFTPLHLLMVRDRVFLPDAERDTLETIHHQLGRLLAGDHAEEALALLDTLQFDPPRIEAALAALIGVAAQPAAPQPKTEAAPAQPAKVTWQNHLPATENTAILGDLARISGVHAPGGLVFTPTG